MSIALRRAELGDADLLSALATRTYSEAFGHSMRASDLSAHLRNNLSPEQVRKMIGEDTLLLAYKEDRLIGFVQFGDARIGNAHISNGSTEPLRIQPGDKEVRRLYVLAEFQNRGVGTRLMDAALADRRLTSANVYLNVWEDNGDAQRFYERYGFAKVGEQAFQVASGEETGVDFIMVRRSKADIGEAELTDRTWGGG